MILTCDLEEAALSGETHYLVDEALKACEELGFTIGYHQGIRGSDGRKRATEARAQLLQALQKGLAQGQRLAQASVAEKILKARHAAAGSST